MAECDTETEAEKLRKVSTPVPRKVLEDIRRERPDLADYIDKVPVRQVPQGSMGQYDGWHHWHERRGSVEVFVATPQKEIIKHELCHSKVLNQLGVDAYSKLTETQKELLTELCGAGKEDGG